MKICFLAPANNYHTEKWCKWFVGHGHEVEVVSFINGWIDNVKVHYIDAGVSSNSGDLKKLMDLERILSSDEYLDHVKGEGGTGIPKICKIIRKDLRKNGIIKFGLKEQENKFFIEIEI